MSQTAETILRLESRTGLVRRRAWLEPLLLSLVLAVWFGYELGSRALWAPDEGRYAEIPREMVESSDYLTPRLNGVKYFEKPPLVYWLTAGSIKFFGLNEWALRLWPALFALLGCLAVYFLGKRLHGEHAGLFAAIVLASNPLYDLLGGALTLDMPLAALLTAALGAFLLGVREPPGMRRRLWLYAFYAATALAVLAKGLVGIAIPAVVIGAWIVVLNEWRLLREIHLGSGILILFAIAAPWHILVSQANPEFAQFYFIHEHVDRFLTTTHNRYEPMWFFLPVLVAGMFPWSALLPQVLRETFSGLWRERRQRRETWFLLLWASLPFAFFSMSSSKLVPYILPVLPPLALLLGCWLARAWERCLRPARSTLLILLALAVVLAAGLALLPQLSPNSVSVKSAFAQLGFGFYAIAGALLLAGTLPFASHMLGGHRATLVVLCASSALLLLTFDLTLSRLDVGRSVKDLALALDLKPGDEVMTYEEYYQDLPVYLQRRITVVNWTGELEFGTTVDPRPWMIDTATFRRRWLEPQTIYLLTNPEKYAKLLAAPPGPICRMHSRQRVVVVVNRECRP